MPKAEVPPEFRELVSWNGKEAKLANCGLSSLPEWLANLTELTRLNLDNNQLTTLPAWLENLPRLQSISLNDNQLTVFPGWLSNLPGLISLSLTRNQLTALPESSGDFRALFYLHLDGNQLTGLPEWLGDLSQLNRISLAGNRLTALPDSFCHLPHLAYLDLNSNDLTVLPESLGNLTRLTELYLKGNQLVTLADSVGDLIRLTRLDLDGNRLTALPDSVGNLTALTYLRIENNQLATLPESIGQLTSLRFLTLEGNQLAALPESVGNLAALGGLYLKGNQLTSLPESAGNLTRLTRLGLEGNQLTVLPEWIGGLTSLSGLGLAANRLATLPDSLGNLSRLSFLHLQDNPLGSPLREIAESGTEAVKDYLSLLSDRSTERWVSKMLIVGEGAVGKTSLVKRLSGQPYDPYESTTHGIRITDIILGHPARRDVDMRLSSWDFGGQDIYHATHQFFLTDRSLFLLLWNARQGWEQSKIPYWLDIIKARAPHARVILVATHAGDRPADFPLNDLRDSYPQIVGNSIVDNATGDGIDELRRRLAAQAAELPLMGSRWPASWVAGVEAITTQGLKHATPEDLYNRLAQAGVADRSHQAYLLRALHLLGDILYFDEDEDLRDTVILQPQWVSAYIAKVLDSQDVAARQGVLTRLHERELWSDLDPGLRDRFLVMMERFDLSYRITEDAAAASLIVEQLRWDNPPYQELWNDALTAAGAHEIRLRYRLSTLPPGVPTWFIAREHRFTTGLQWRSGALLRHTDPRVLGLIRAERSDNVVDLAVRGPVPQHFFSILQDGFESTISRYQGLEMTKLVPCGCAQGNGDQPGYPCLNLYEYGLLLRRVERGIREVECPLSFHKVDVTELLFGIAPTHTDQIICRLESIDQEVKAVGRDVKDTRADSAWNNRELLKGIRRIQKQLEAVCPSIFTLTRAPGRSRLPGIHRLELRLYCEEPGSLHATMASPYVIEQPTEWLKKIAPYLSVLITVLKHAAPLAGPILGITAEKLAQQRSSDIGLMAELVSQLPDSLPAGLSAEEELRPLELDVDYRALQALLNRVDPDRHWADLSRIRTPEEEILWLCRDHAQQQTRPGARAASLPSAGDE